MAMALSPEAFDDVLQQMEDCFCQLEAAQGSIVQRSKVELNLLTKLEWARDFMDKIVRMQASRSDLESIFGGDCLRISRTRAVLDAADFSDMNAGDQRLSTCLNACESVEKVLSDLGLGMTLRQAQQQQRQVLQRKGVAECDSPIAFGSMELDLLGEQMDVQLVDKGTDVVTGGNKSGVDPQRQVLQRKCTFLSEASNDIVLDFDFVGERESFMQKNQSQTDLVGRDAETDVTPGATSVPSSASIPEPSVEATPSAEPSSPLLKSSAEEIDPAMDQLPAPPEISKQQPVVISIVEPKFESPAMAPTPTELPQSMHARPLQRPSWTHAEAATGLERPLSPAPRDALKSAVHLDPMSHWRTPQKATSVHERICFTDKEGDLVEYVVENGKLIKYVNGVTKVGGRPNDGVVTQLKWHRELAGWQDCVQDQNGAFSHDFPLDLVFRLRLMADRAGVLNNLPKVTHPQPTSLQPASPRSISPQPHSPRPTSPRPTLLERPRASTPCKLVEVPVEVVQGSRRMQLLSNVPSAKSLTVPGPREMVSSPRSVAPSRSMSHLPQHAVLQNSMRPTVVHQPLIQTTQVVTRRSMPAVAEQFV